MGAYLLDISKTLIEYLARAVEFAAAIIIGMAALETTLKSVVLFFRPSAPPEAKVQVRLVFARWLAVALEFELAADILNTAATPRWSDIEKLAAIATLRTALNYFLEREIKEESSPTQLAAEATTLGPAASPLRPDEPSTRDTSADPLSAHHGTH